MRILSLVSLLVLAGCPYTTDARYDTIRDVDQDGEDSIRFGGRDCLDNNPDIDICDRDNDGVDSIAAGGEDCDDDNINSFPGAPEVCDGEDNDCDGFVDNDDADVVGEPSWFVDEDEDTYGDPSRGFACEVPELNTVRNELDCDDGTAAVRPGVQELCDGFDNNCDGNTDDVGLWFSDEDNDGYGADGTQVAGSCTLGDEDGLASVGGDCDDQESAVHPGAAETAYGQDQNCNPVDNWDVDGDGFVPDEHWAAAVSALTETQTSALDFGDCDDSRPEVNPVMPEICNGLDDDCDAAVDVADTSLMGQVVTAYEDGDGDGFFGVEITICANQLVPETQQLTPNDCLDGDDDPDGLVNPNATERCDDIDNNCDGRTDWSFETFPDQANDDDTNFFLDQDGDGFGDEAVFACRIDPVEGIAGLAGDCDDDSGLRFPGAPEICGNPLREDCRDADIYDCDADGVVGVYPANPDGAGVGVVSDCDDENPLVAPDAAEVCDGEDNDCDGFTDSEDVAEPGAVDLTTATTWYTDLDADGWGDASTVGTAACDPPPQTASQIDDCDDADPDNFPSASWFLDGDGDGYGTPSSETTNGICSPPLAVVGSTWVRRGGDCNDEDIGLHPATLWYADEDGDGFGNATLTLNACAPGSGWARPSAGEDCDDTDPASQATTTYYVDADGDGSGDDTTAVEACSLPLDGPTYVTLGGDCDDTLSAVNPLRLEICNGRDDDCNGFVDDEDVSVLVFGGVTGFEDADGDGFGSIVQRDFCDTIGSGFVDNPDDCDDLNADVSPIAAETCANGVDENCDGRDSTTLQWYEDVDGDGWGDTFLEENCVQPAAGNPVQLRGDCDDSAPDVFPGADTSNACNDIDNDCDGVIEPNILWRDVDGDGLGDPNMPAGECTPSPISFAPVGFADNADDCVDNDPGIGIPDFRADLDGDGFGDPDNAFCDAAPGRIEGGREDCDDADGLVNPNAPELPCNGIDDDCDGNVDEGSVCTPVDWYLDVDQDGFGQPGTQVASIASPGPLYVQASVGDDCDDFQPATHPAATEVCDGVDNNCDGELDAIAAAELCPVWYDDTDEDGFGDPDLSLATYAPTRPPGFVSNTDDCDPATDTAPSIVYRDDDGDGQPGTPVLGCEDPPLLSTLNSDCDDTNPAVAEGMDEVCDGVDNNCDGELDTIAGVELCPVWYDDADDDGFGDPDLTLATYAPTRPPGFVSNTDDCDPATDTAPSIVYRDDDGDGHPGTPVLGCEDPPLLSTLNSDCDDTSPTINTDADEVCDGRDNNCDGIVDFDGVTSVCDTGGPGCNLVATRYDFDGDTFGGAPGPMSCDDEVGFGFGVVLDTDPIDCNDFDGSETVPVDVFSDVDGDGFGALGMPTTQICPSLIGPNQSLVNTDCDDTEATVYDGAPEICGDGFTNDCLGPDTEIDNDGDGAIACRDCDDTNSAVSPDFPEVCGDMLDNNCDKVFIVLNDTDTPPADGTLDPRWDAPNPWTGEAPVPTGLLDGTLPYIAAVRADLPSWLDSGDLCGPVDIPTPTSNEPFWFGRDDEPLIAAIQIAPTDGLPDFTTNNTCPPGAPQTTGDVVFIDSDFDGTPESPESAQEVTLDCNGVAFGPLGFAPFLGEWDCAPNDPTAFLTDVTFDQDFAFGELSCGEGEIESPGPNCSGPSRLLPTTESVENFFQSCDNNTVGEVLTSLAFLPEQMNSPAGQRHLTLPVGFDELPPLRTASGNPMLVDGDLLLEGLDIEASLDVPVDGFLTLQDSTLFSTIVSDGTLQLTDSVIEPISPAITPLTARATSIVNLDHTSAVGHPGQTLARLEGEATLSWNVDSGFPLPQEYPSGYPDSVPAFDLIHGFDVVLDTASDNGKGDIFLRNVFVQDVPVLLSSQPSTTDVYGTLTLNGMLYANTRPFSGPVVDALRPVDMNQSRLLDLTAQPNAPMFNDVRNGLITFRSQIVSQSNRTLVHTIGPAESFADLECSGLRHEGTGPLLQTDQLYMGTSYAFGNDMGSNVCPLEYTGPRRNVPFASIEFTYFSSPAISCMDESCAFDEASEVLWNSLQHRPEFDLESGPDSSSCDQEFYEPAFCSENI